MPPLSRLEPQLIKECEHATANVIADAAYGIEALTRGILQHPVLVSLAGEDRAGITAAHSDDHIRLSYTRS